MTDRVLPHFVLGAIALGCAFSLVLSSDQVAFLFTTDKAETLNSEQLRWWFLLLPIGISGAALAAACVVGAKRALQRSDRASALGAAWLLPLGLATLTLTVALGSRLSTI